jgi:deoxyribonuclease V
MSSPSVIACLDVAYSHSAAAVACALIHSWDAAKASQMLVRQFDGPAEEYEPGAFYKRELPLLQATISELGDRIETIVIDGYVWLSADELPGLGGRLFTSLGERIPVIGVAKNRFRNDTWSAPILRGTSQRPLYVTAAGIEQQRAAEFISRMHGDHRMPTILAAVDRAARDGIA